MRFNKRALGIIGVNLLYGAFFLNHEPDKLVESLLDGLNTRRIEIDMIEFSGTSPSDTCQSSHEPAIGAIGLKQSAMFSAKGEVLQPRKFFYKKPILVERGSFRPTTKCESGYAPRSSREVHARAWG